MQYVAKVYFKHGTHTGELTTFQDAHNQANALLKDKPKQPAVYAIAGMELVWNKETKRMEQDWSFYRSYSARQEQKEL